VSSLANQIYNGIRDRMLVDLYPYNIFGIPLMFLSKSYLSYDNIFFFFLDIPRPEVVQ